jgi:hypothetical protein
MILSKTTTTVSRLFIFDHFSTPKGRVFNLEQLLADVKERQAARVLNCTRSPSHFIGRGRPDDALGGETKPCLLTKALPVPANVVPISSLPAKAVFSLVPP